MLARKVWPTRLVWESTPSIMRITRLVPAGSVPLGAAAGAGGGGVRVRTGVGPAQGGPVTGIGARTGGCPAEGGPAGRSAGVAVRALVRAFTKFDAQDIGDVDGAHVDAVVDAHR